MARDDRPPPEPEPRRAYTVELTAREAAALERAAWAVTSTDDDNHRANYADAALKACQRAVREQRR